MTFILPMFRKAGIGPRDVMPGHIAWEVAKEKGEDVEKATENDLRLVGIVLGSFLSFANNYYSEYRKDNEPLGLINRHAIIHGAGNQNIWTKENATRLLLFLDLTLALEPIFEILLNEE
ncbi:hypothetical protein [Sulfurovum sp. NBC37-1]|uniref:hypothetical protein n=1 Tax=Sulfurovum sp. (strain NBC37-1) TaxID=387093 RepID=UPI00015874D0|nr:hypothetical protein [Sulfurovum sp. NBC37-1]BAF71776.1 hypothetical protein SUN_0818 [Sulfurovum sp. NBC37-1]